VQRRMFLTSSLAAAALGTAPAGAAADARLQGASSRPEGKARYFFELRRYRLNSGPQQKLCDDFFRGALIPALNRLNITPVGVFNVTIGPDSPTIFVLMPSLSLEALVTAEARLAQDAEYVKAGAPFLNAPATQPAFVRMESSLMQAFEKIPGLTLPKATAANGPRVFELRTYESSTDQDHKRKVEMMESGEEAIFAKAGFTQVFYGDTLIGGRMPNLTYMLSYESVSDRDRLWKAFSTAPEWKAMQSEPRYAFEAIVSSITSTILTPTAYSQI
jgi:NIPSNAP